MSEFRMKNFAGLKHSACKIHESSASHVQDSFYFFFLAAGVRLFFESPFDFAWAAV